MTCPARPRADVDPVVGPEVDPVVNTGPLRGSGAGGPVLTGGETVTVELSLAGSGAGWRRLGALHRQP